jgi:integrase
MLSSLPIWRAANRLSFPLCANGIIPAQPVPEPEPERITVAAALDRYSEYIQYHRSLRTFRTYRPILAGFKSFCDKTHVDDVERQDLLDFATHCMKQGQKGKSVYNKLVVISQVMKQHGKAKLLKAADWPSFVETVRPIYENAELEKLFKACAPHEEMRFKFYLMSGFRDAEGRFVTWRDVDFKHMAVRVTAKPHWRFHPKNWEEREVPVPQKLIAMLQKFRPTNAGPDDPLFPSATGRPDGAMLEKLKGVAWRGKLNCGARRRKSLPTALSVSIGAGRGLSADDGSFTNSGTPTPRATCRTASTSARCSNGWGIAISPRRWSISRASGIAIFRSDIELPPWSRVTTYQALFFLRQLNLYRSADPETAHPEDLAHKLLEGVQVSLLRPGCY